MLAANKAPEGRRRVPASLRDCANPPEQPVVILAAKRHKKAFATLVHVASIKPGVKPDAAAAQIKTAQQFLPRGIRLHRLTSHRHIIKLTLASQAGYSKFEGTPAQMLQEFPRALAQMAEA